MEQASRLCFFGVCRVGGLTALMLCLLADFRVRAQTYATILSLGDSLSDTGNNPPTGDYFEGRWSNGSLWNEYLAADLGAALTNVAYAGSETSDLTSQAEQAARLSLDFSTTLCTVWSGGNDFIDGATNGLNTAAWDRLVSKAVANISAALERLYASGARHILVVNLPDLSKTPAALALPASFQTFVRGKVVLFNTKLEAALVSYRKTRPQVHLATVNAFELLDQVLADPAGYGFINVTSDALAAFVDPDFNGPAADYLFWDQIHPTTKAHQLFSQWTTNALAAVPPVFVEEPFSRRAVAGSNVVFTAQASGATSYQWRFRGHALAGATNQAYSIEAVRTSNAGAYSVTARNTYGSVTSTNAVLTVILPPKILRQPANLTLPDGKTARFRVLAAGSAPLRYQWQWNDAPLPGATNAVLSLPTVQTNQAGTYSVMVTNAGGYAASSNAMLTVTGSQDN